MNRSKFIDGVGTLEVILLNELYSIGIHRLHAIIMLLKNFVYLDLFYT